MRVWGLANCDVTRLAVATLRAAGHEVDLGDIRNPGLTADDLAALIAARGDKALNRASTSWRGLTPIERAMPLARLLAMEPTLIKRPVILFRGQWYQGWTPEVRAALSV